MMGMGGDALGDFEFRNMAGLRFSSVAISRPPGGAADGIGAHLVAVGSHDEPLNTVCVWSAALVQDPRYSDVLLSPEALDNFDEGDGRPPAPFKVEGSVRTLQFWDASGSSGGGAKLWAGTSTGNVS
eukprot:CAMPEP_0180377812 /NCGR_PEP_ID=MMETSP0989-20121125/24356_1 /TAXON_ID=697907 /ORGANISM="non described non described, Strain CCMP2293" /LENGTH=126 /DNA_ID=CAMNT_0022376535 /DNA_START=103 /DNA_END=480 /DNA_ORIENTATION=-